MSWQNITWLIQFCKEIYLMNWVAISEVCTMYTQMSTNSVQKFSFRNDIDVTKYWYKYSVYFFSITFSKGNNYVM